MQSSLGSLHLLQSPGVKARIAQKSVNISGPEGGNTACAHSNIWKKSTEKRETEVVSSEQILSITDTRERI